MSEKPRWKLSPLETVFGVVGVFAFGTGMYHGFYDEPGFHSFKECFERPEVYLPILVLTSLGPIKSTRIGKSVVGGVIAGILTGAVLTAAGYGLGYVGR